MFGVTRHRRHLRVRRPHPHRRDARLHRAALRWLDGRRRHRSRRGDPLRRARERRREGRRAPRRDHLLRPPRGPAGHREAAARRREAALRVLLGRERGALPRRHRSRAARRLPPALDDPQPPDPRRGDLPRRRPAHPERGRDVPDQRLARARGLRLLRHRLRRPPRAHPHPDARRLAGPPPAQGLPAGRHPGGVQGRDHPAARPADGATADDRPRARRLRPAAPRPARDGSSPSPARTGTRSPRASPTSTTTRSS